MLIEQIRETGILFDVVEEAVVTASGTVIPGKKAIVNCETGEPISVVGDKYKVATMNEVFTAMDEQLQSSTLDLTGMTVDVHTSHKGARAMIDVVLPAHEIDLGGDITKMRITSLNSYDGSWKYTSRAGGIRIACLNGQVLGNIFAKYSSRHNGSMNIAAGAEHISTLLQTFNEAKDYWSKMMKSKVNIVDVNGVFALFLDGTPTIKDQEKFEKRTSVKKLTESYEDYVLEHGKTVWSLYNALTDFVTHKEYNAGTKAAMKNFYEDRLIVAASSRVFTR